MTKLDFVKLVQKNAEYSTQEEARVVIEAFMTAVTEGLAKKETIQLIGFGTFSTVDIPEKTGVIPGTKKTYTKEAHTAPKFKFGKNVKDAVEYAR